VPRILNLGVNSATTQDWLNASRGMRISAYDPSCQPIAPIADRASSSLQLDLECSTPYPQAPPPSQA
jgi:hypothetical protein